MSLDACPPDAELARIALERRARRNTSGNISTAERPGSTVLPAGVPTVTLGNARPRSERGVMNKTEARVAGYLEREKAAGRVLEYHFDRISLRLADATYYRPDFFVLLPCALVGMDDAVRIVIVEAKGHWEDDARAKFKIAAEQYPHFTFIACRRLKKGETARAQLVGLDGFEAETLAPRRS